MGLDWNPLARPKVGRAEEFAQLFHTLEGGAESDDKEKLLERLGEISQPPFELLGAPRVGFDAAADEWLRESLRENGKLDDLERVRESMHGYYVLDLLPPCDGFPIYSNYGAYDGLDRYSFRAKFLDDLEDILGPELYERAYKRMLPAELEEYGNQLLATARAFAESRGVAGIAEGPEPPDDFGSDESRAHILFAAARWCLYWAKRGHGLDPWF
jgi:hypothetical protein